MNSDKNVLCNNTMMIIILIILFIIIIFLIRNFYYSNMESTKCSEPFSSQADPVQSDAIINLASISNDIYINNESLTIPAKTTTLQDIFITGNLMVDGSINFTNKNTLLMNVLPRGIIFAWNSPDNLPQGWAFCDGTTVTFQDGTSFVTPDLRARFILGSSSDGKAGPSGIDGLNYRAFGAGDIGPSGGEETHTLSVDEIPNHMHGFTIPSGNGSGGGNLTTITDNKNQFSLPTDSTGGGVPHNNMPPYYVLAYIIKL